MVGRDSEMENIRAGLRGGGVLLCGEAGVGKTTLARHIVQISAGAWWTAASDSARRIPLAPFAGLLERPAPSDPFAALAAVMDAVHRGKYSVIGVDDVHLTDHLSAILLHQIVIERRVEVLLTACSGEPLPEAVAALWKDGYLTRLDVVPLSRNDTVRSIESALGGRLEGLSADLIWQASRGNPSLVRHVTDGAVEAGFLRPAGGVWQWRGPTAVTPGLAGLLGGRVDRLPASEKRVVHLLAVAGPLTLSDLCAMADGGAVERVERRGLIGVTDADGAAEVRFTHTVLGEVVKHVLGDVACRRVAAEIVAALGDRPFRSAAERLRYVALAVNCDARVDPGVLVSAAEDALAATNVTLAERIARCAADRGAGLAAGEVLARALVWQGRSAEAEAILDGVGIATMTDFELARWGIARVANLQWGLGDTAAAEEILAMLRQRVAQPRLLLMIDGLASALLVLKGRLDDAVAAAERVAGDPAAPAAAIGWAAFAATMAAAMMGRTAEAARWVERGHQVSERIDSLLRFLLALGEVRALTLSGDFAAAEARSGDIVRITCPEQYRVRMMASVLAGTVYLGRGRLRDAVATLEETLAALGDQTAAPWTLPARLLLAQALCGLGRPDSAAPLIAELRTHVESGITMFGPAVRLAEAWLAAAEGHLSGAIATATDAADRAAESGQGAIELLALHAAARFGDRGCTDRLIAVADRIGGPLAAADSCHAAGVRDRDGAVVFAAAREFERIGAAASAADAAAQAAALFESAGMRRQALEAAASADRLAAACGGLRTPALRNAAKPLPLSAREREVAALVALGLSNRDIADRLTVSLRTVEGHLYRIFQKLDVTQRDELAALIGG